MTMLCQGKSSGRMGDEKGLGRGGQWTEVRILYPYVHMCEVTWKVTEVTSEGS